MFRASRWPHASRCPNACRCVMDKPNPQDDSSRRDFLKGLTTFPLVALLGAKLPPATPVAALSGLPTAASSTRGQDCKKFVAIQIGGRSFVDEGVEQALDVLQEKGGVNVLMPTVFTYGRGLAGRQVPGQPLPDHGAQEYDEIHGGIYTALHAEFRAKSRLQDVRAPNRQRRGAVDNYTRGNQCTLEIISLRTPDS